jgi:glycosyltransferase involved in cell wall biosynthesis
VPVRVSVVTPTYDRAHAIHRPIESVRRQTFRDFEHVVVDDASTDDTDDVVAELDHERLRFLTAETNRGANHARNRGIEAARGEYVCFLDSDDRLAPTYLERVVPTLDALEDAGDVSGVGGVFTSKRLEKDGELFSYNVARGWTTYDDAVRSNPIGGFSGTTFRREVFDTVGLLDESFESSQDYEFYLRVLAAYPMWGIVDALVVRDYTSEARISRDVDRKRAGFQRLLEKHGERLTDERLAQQAFSEAMYHGENGDRADAIALLRESIATDPSRLPAYVLLPAAALGRRPFLLALRALRALRQRVRRLQYWRAVRRPGAE